jgi:hypothetical protein
MLKLKPLEGMLEDVKPGDLVRIKLTNSDFVGYRWGGISVGPDLHTEGARIIFRSLNPLGTTKNLGYRFQQVGIDIDKSRIGDEVILGYEVLRRYNGT